MPDEKYIDDRVKNKYDNSPYRIPLRNRTGVIVEFALVEAKDFERVNVYKWHLEAGGYAQASCDGKKVKMHHLVFRKAKDGYVIDHINEDKLDNRSSNLREVSHSENNHNRTKRKKNASSQYKGVYYNNINKTYVSQYAQVQLYYGENEKDAAVLYDIYTFQKFGEHANNNQLILYEDAMKYTFEDKPKRNLPTNITITTDKHGQEHFCVRKYFRGKSQFYTFKKLEDAITKLDDINFKIKLSLVIEHKLHSLTPIKRNTNGIAIIIACKGEVIFVSDEDWHNFSKQYWYVDNYGYSLNGHNKKMHVLLLPCDDKSRVVHHRNGNTLDNRRENLVIATRAENAHQKKKIKNTTSKYFGVSYIKKQKKWEAKFYKNGIKYYVGLFEKEDDAARAYNVKVVEIYGEFANLNIVD